MSGRRVLWVWSLTIMSAAFVVGSCGDDGTGPAPLSGPLTVTLSSTAGPGAAFLFRVSGEGITAPQAINPGHRLFTNLAGDTLTVAVIGSIAAGELLRFDVPDVNRAASYRVSLQGVAGSDNSLLPLSAFSLKIVP
ncbi:MAG: hypothetical protein PVI01_12785 [Gemmatimonadales bacterium]